MKLTFTGTTFNDACGTTGVVLNNSYDVKVSFISDDNVINEKTFTGKNVINIDESQLLTGDNISIKVISLNFDSTNIESGKGTGVTDMKAKVEDADNKVLAEEDIGWLHLCTDTWYEVHFKYNKTNRTHNTETKTHAF